MSPTHAAKWPPPPSALPSLRVRPVRQVERVVGGGRGGVPGHRTDAEVESGHVDPHGASVVEVSFTGLLDFRLPPRLKNIGSIRPYRPNGTPTGPDKEHVATSLLAPHLLRSGLVPVDTLLLRQVPAEPKWAGKLTTEDRRSEVSGVLFGTECLEIFQSVSIGGDLERAVVANTHRRYIFPSTARADIEDAAAGLFRTGLLRPAPGPQEASAGQGPPSRGLHWSRFHGRSQVRARRSHDKRRGHTLRMRLQYRSLPGHLPR
nr:Tn3 family transposase [Streptomyces taklimakanensis]